MSQDKEWYKAASEKEQIHLLAEGALRQFNNNVDLSEIYPRVHEIGDIEDEYDRDGSYGSPFDDMTVFDIEDKQIPSDSANIIQQSDTLYVGIARAAKAGMEELETDKKMDPQEYEPNQFFASLIGIIRHLAARIERKPWSYERHGVFFNDPIFIDTVFQ